MRKHTRAWYARNERRIKEPIKNTKRYYYKWEIIKICTIILAPWGIRNLWRLHKNLKSYFSLALDCMNKGRTITNDGAPGAGKTFTGSNMAYFLAISQWDKLKNDYFTANAMRAEWVRQGNIDKLIALKGLEESYQFYLEREQEYIPCLVSSLPLREYGTGRMSYVLNPEILMQLQRCPEYSVLFHDESGRLFGSETSKTDNEDVKDFWRFIRHMLDAMVINTNQDSNQNAIYMRRSTDYVNHLYGQKWILEPKALLRRFERRSEKLQKKVARGKISEQKAQYRWQELYYLDKYMRTIGFREIKHRLTTRDFIPVGDEEYYVLPAIGGVEYDDRAYRNLYKCKDQEIKLQCWRRLVADEVERSDYDKEIKGKS